MFNLSSLSLHKIYRRHEPHHPDLQPIGSATKDDMFDRDPQEPTYQPLIERMTTVLDERMSAFARHGSSDISYLQNERCWGVDLETSPLFLLWDGDPRYGYLVRHALGVWNTIGVMNNPPGHDFYGIGFASEAEFLEAAAANPDLVAVTFCDDDRYEEILSRTSIRQANVPMVEFAAGKRSMPAQCAPHLQGNLTVFDHLADDLSKATLLATQLYRVTEDKRWLSPILQPEEQMYFKSGLFEFGDDEIFIDGGGALGDTVEAFEEVTNGKYRHIHSFEPGALGAGLMRRAFAKEPRVTVHQLGIYDSVQTLPFSVEADPNGAINGVLNPNSESFIQTETLDNMELGGPTFIKFDIEGFELEGLTGAADTIAQYRPNMAICTYHKPRDFLELFNKIKDIRNDYDIYLRHYTPTYGDSVYYCC